MTLDERRVLSRERMYLIVRLANSHKDLFGDPHKGEKLRSLHCAARAITDGCCIIKKCGACGHSYAPSEWFNLPLVGYQHNAYLSGEYRQCPCNSTLLYVTRRKVPHGQS